MTRFTRIGIIFCLLSVIFGAFGSHILKEFLHDNQLTSFKIGVQYQIFHGLTILFISLKSRHFLNTRKSLRIMTTGIILFSFSIYLISMKDILNISIQYITPLTPLGGILLIISWVMLLMNVKKNNLTNNSH